MTEQQKVKYRDLIILISYHSIAIHTFANLKTQIAYYESDRTMDLIIDYVANKDNEIEGLNNIISEQKEKLDNLRLEYQEEKNGKHQLLEFIKDLENTFNRKGK